MYQKVLVAVDGSHSSELALEQAIIVAKSMGGEVRAVLVVDGSVVPQGGHDATLVARGVREDEESVLADSAARLTQAGIGHSVQLIGAGEGAGAIAAAIVAESESWGASLIVLGTHGRRGVSRMVLGSVSEGVVAATLRPVLLIRSGFED